MSVSDPSYRVSSSAQATSTSVLLSDSGLTPAPAGTIGRGSSAPGGPGRPIPGGAQPGIPIHVKLGGRRILYRDLSLSPSLSFGVFSMFGAVVCGWGVPSDVGLASTMPGVSVFGAMPLSSCAPGFWVAAVVTVLVFRGRRRPWAVVVSGFGVEADSAVAVAACGVADALDCSCWAVTSDWPSCLSSTDSWSLSPDVSTSTSVAVSLSPTTRVAMPSSTSPTSVLASPSSPRTQGGPWPPEPAQRPARTGLPARQAFRPGPGGAQAHRTVYRRTV
ncbi:hypothetical protein [Kibdelosporangium philippinense]|uniref:hypothetical protein n=1 Tax=Kibdelosporangium philippinense TaxID=211113 RepID=UPI00360F0A3B